MKISTPVGHLFYQSQANLITQISWFKIDNAHEVNEQFEQEIYEYFDSKRKFFDFKYQLNVSPFSRLVLEATLNIPYGKTKTYGEIAREINKPKASRAVAQALKHNPLAIVIPCHRVLSFDQKIIGYAGKQAEMLDLRKKLLAIENIQ